MTRVLSLPSRVSKNDLSNCRIDSQRDDVAVSACEPRVSFPIIFDPVHDRPIDIVVTSSSPDANGVNFTGSDSEIHIDTKRLKVATCCSRSNSHCSGVSCGMGTLATSMVPAAGASTARNQLRKRARRGNRFGMLALLVKSGSAADEFFDSTGQDEQLLAVPFPANI